MPTKMYTVTELTRELKELLEASFVTVWVEGEISNYMRHSSGHRYFTLKDKNAQLRCVMWRWMGERLFFEPQDGMKVKATGQITVYEKAGQYQLVVKSLQPAGIGELELAFQQLKRRLAAEGLFDAEHKIPIPQFPDRLGVVTSPTGAAIRDILNITNRRAPWVEIIIWPVAVQGRGAAAQISAAIRGFNRLGLVDLLIVGRGGGSLEELWPFNEEQVARAIYHSKLPVISAVGHEIDFTIADFVADARAPTPSAAAEMAVPDGAVLSARLADYCARISSATTQTVRDGKRHLAELKSRYGLKRPLEIIAHRAQRCDELTRLVKVYMSHRLVSLQNKSKSVMEKLNIVSPRSILRRGFSFCQNEKGIPIKNFSQVAVNDRVNVVLYRGGFQSRVTRVFPSGGGIDKHR